MGRGEGTGSLGRHAEHLSALDGLRGLAALVVVARHVLNAFAMSEGTRRGIIEGPLALVLNSDGAVHTFFVLSGYVLVGSIERSRRAVDVLQFYTRRIFRIHPPYVAAVLFSWAASFLYYTTPGTAAVTEWLRTFASVHLSADRLLESFLFPGHASLQLPVGWTLTAEMALSFLMPLMVLAARPL